MSLWHWLIQAENPIKAYGFFPVFLWIVVIIGFFSVFIVLEVMGIKRVHGMIPMTWFWRCAPRLINLILFGFAIWHFIFVTTKVGK